jgi:hypothetical protein
MKAPAKPTTESKQIVISPPNLKIATFKIRGTSPYVQHAFGGKAAAQMRETQVAGSTAKNKKKKEPKDFDGMREDATHYSDEGWIGIPAAAFRNAMISACRVAGFVMTKAKLSLFCMEDGYDRHSGDGLVKITKGTPIHKEHHVRLATGVIDIHARPMWMPGWESMVRIRYDADQFTETDVANLMMRVGMQIGVGEGRHDSKTSCGMGWGTFELA